MTTTVTRQTAADTIVRQERFKNSGGTFSGGYLLDTWAEYGKLPIEYRAAFQAAATLGTYVVWSYRTPIAWFDHIRQTWVTPDVRYSVTTTNHQSIVRQAIARMES